MVYHTFVTYFADDGGNRRAGARAIEPPPDTGHAVRGNLYAVIELLQVPDAGTASGGNDASAGADAPADTARGRIVPYTEADAARISEHLLATVQSTYYSARGSQSTVLTEAIGRVGETLRTINERRPHAPVYAGITCAAFLNGLLTIACSGPALALIVTGGHFEQFPSAPPAAHFDPARQMLGGTADVSVKNYRRQLQQRGVFFLGGSLWLERMPVRKLLGTIAPADSENRSDVVDYLRQQNGDPHVPGLLVVTESDADGGGSAAQRGSAPPASHSSPPQSSSPQSPAQQSSRPEQTSSVRSPLRGRRSGGGLPTAVSATPPPVHVTPTPGAAERSNEWHAPSTPRSESGIPAGVQHVGTNAAWPAEPVAPSAAPTHQSAGTEPSEPQSYSASAPAYLSGTSASGISVDVAGEVPPTEAEPASQGPQTNLWEDARARLLGAWGLLATMLPERKSSSTEQEASADPSAASAGGGAQAARADVYGRSFVPATPPAQEDLAPGAEAEPQSSAATGGVSAATAGAQQALADSWERMRAFTPPAPARGGRARLFITLAVAILVLIPIIVAGVVWQRGASLRAEGEILVSAAQANVDSADAALDLGDKTTARAELTKAQENLAQAVVLIGSTPAINDLLQQIERELQEVLQVSPLYGLVEPLARFPLEASPRRLLIVDQDIYVLDQGRHLVQRFRLDAERQMITDPEGEIVLQRGDVIDGVTVGSMVDITWQEPIPGIEDRSSLLVLDGNNNIFRYNQRVEGATNVLLAEQELWQSPTQIKNYLGRLYLADSGRGQIYRYNPGQYEVAPQPWLLAPTEQGLAGLQTMVIEGDIWLLFSNGLLLRYSQGQQVPFALENDVGLVSEPVDIFIGDQDSSSIYLADAGQERILIFGKDGSYMRQLQAAEDHPLRDLRAIYVDEAEGTIYILTRSSLFQHPLPQ